MSFSDAYYEWLMALPVEVQEGIRQAFPPERIELPRRWPPDPRQLDRIWQGAADLELRMESDSDTPTRWAKPADLFGANLSAPFDIATGAAPVIMLTSAQQMALWFSDPPDAGPISNPAFDGGVAVIFHDPVSALEPKEAEGLLSTFLGSEVSHGGAVDLVGCYVSHPSLGAVTLLVRLSADGDTSFLTFSGISAGQLSESRTLPDAFTAACNLVLCARNAAYGFGMQQTEPRSLRADRAERRRRDRAAGKRPESRVTVRYLRDHGDKYTIGHATTTGHGHVRPHLRRGHFKNLRTGSMSLPREERPTIRRYQPPVIVNGALGLPKEMIVYRDQTMSRSARANISSSAASSSASSSDE